MFSKISPNISREQNLTALDLRNNQNGAINNEAEHRTQGIVFKRKKKRKQKKNVTSISLQENNTQIDLSSTSIEEDKRAGNTIDINILKNLLNENGEASGRREDRETFNFLQQDELGNKQIDINHLVAEVHILQFNNKKDNDTVSVSSKTADLLSTAKHNVNKTNISTLQSSSTENIPENPPSVRKKKRASNFWQKNCKQIDLNTENLKDKEQTILQFNNCNNVSSKAANSLNTNTVKCRKSREDTNNKSVSGLQNPKLIFSNIDYEFHEANHAIIETFALNIYFSLCADDRETYCLVCDKILQIQNNFRENLCGHIQSKKHIKLLSQMIEDDKECLKAGRLFSKLGLAREYMRSKNGIVECLLCNSKSFSSEVQNDDVSLHDHILSSKHQNFKLSWTSSVKNILRDVHNKFRSVYNVRKYCCEFCNYESTSEIYFAKHLRVPHHTTRLVAVPDYVEKFKFYYCAACLLLWFGNSDMFDRHSEKTEHIRRLTYGSDLDHLPEQVIQLLIMANQNAEVLLMQSNSICYNKTIINYILRDLITELQKYIPNIKAHPFGSRISDLGFADSDIDIFLDCGNMYEGRNSSYNHCQNLITHIVYYLSLNKTIWMVQEMILRSRTPIIKVQHNPSGFICDISVTNGLAVENTKIIKCFNHTFPLCRKMILFLKHWMHNSGLLGSHVITSYALTWCVIFYLQTLLIFPSISQLIKLRNSSWRISGWEVGVSYNFPVKKINHTFEELLLGFFKFYADFKYKSHVICPLLGQPIEKNAFTNLSSLPQDMAPYVAYMHDAYTKEKPQAFFLSPLCVQDPFDLSHNLTKAVNNQIKNQLITRPVKRNGDKLQTGQKKTNALDRYNRMYQKRFLDFEKIMFTCSLRKKNDIECNLQLYAVEYRNMRCLACNVTHLYNIDTLYEHIHCEQHIMQTQLKESSEKQKLKLLRELIKIEFRKCYACNQNGKLMHDTSKIEEHMHYPLHKQNRNKVLQKAMCVLQDFDTVLWYSIQYFACVECKRRFRMKIKFMEHLDKSHNELLRTKDNTKFDFCLLCATLWYNKGGDSVYKLHCKKRTHRYLTRSNDFVIRPLPQSLQELLKNINETVVNLLKLSDDTLKDSRTTQLVDALKHTFEDQSFYVEVYMFGSRVTGLALPNSDIDIYLDFSKIECTSVNYINIYRKETALILQKRSKQIQKYLQIDGENWEIELILDESRTPLIKVKHRLTRLQCDISYTNGLSVENSKLIKSFNTAYPNCRKLILFLKNWILLGNLTGSDGITSYSLSWLVIFYLQVEYKIPTIAALIKSHNHSKIVCGWETGVDVPTKNVLELLNAPICTLLLGFFEYYERFNYMDNVICPLLGKTCHKEIFTEDPSSLPDTMKLYIMQLQTTKPQYFRIDSPMCVQDPLDLSHNLTKAVSILTLKHFKQYCKESASMLYNINGQVCRKKDT
ncbi:uncharacterized protein LOC114943756 isoform X2 [Nylanderia fulva]|uniref:uncharacterized protein LOC114943756 isoform X2 n=1 Tax=Nylanderia fulva TaxID=613905 RepID=UPI0010FB7786|nr:uncharacterized protein LOC114943756 isoform X2 [Nylanderia fulva]